MFVDLLLLCLLVAAQEHRASLAARHRASPRASVQDLPLPSRLSSMLSSAAAALSGGVADAANNDAPPVRLPRGSAATLTDGLATPATNARRPRASLLGRASSAVASTPESPLSRPVSGQMHLREASPLKAASPSQGLIQESELAAIEADLQLVERLLAASLNKVDPMIQSSLRSLRSSLDNVLRVAIAAQEPTESADWTRFPLMHTYPPRSSGLTPAASEHLQQLEQLRSSTAPSALQSAPLTYASSQPQQQAVVLQTEALAVQGPAVLGQQQQSVPGGRDGQQARARQLPQPGHGQEPQQQGLQNVATSAVIVENHNEQGSGAHIQQAAGHEAQSGAQAEGQQGQRQSEAQAGVQHELHEAYSHIPTAPSVPEPAPSQAHHISASQPAVATASVKALAASRMQGSYASRHHRARDLTPQRQARPSPSSTARQGAGSSSVSSRWQGVEGHAQRSASARSPGAADDKQEQLSLVQGQGPQALRGSMLAAAVSEQPSADLSPWAAEARFGSNRGPVLPGALRHRKPSPHKQGVIQQEQQAALSKIDRGRFWQGPKQVQEQGQALSQQHGSEQGKQLVQVNAMKQDQMPEHGQDSVLMSNVSSPVSTPFSTSFTQQQHHHHQQHQQQQLVYQPYLHHHQHMLLTQPKESVPHQRDVQQQPAPPPPEGHTPRQDGAISHGTTLEHGQTIFDVQSQQAQHDVPGARPSPQHIHAAVQPPTWKVQSEVMSAALPVVQGVAAHVHVLATPAPAQAHAVNSEAEQPGLASAGTVNPTLASNGGLLQQKQQHHHHHFTPQAEQAMPPPQSHQLGHRHQSQPQGQEAELLNEFLKALQPSSGNLHQSIKPTQSPRSTRGQSTNNLQPSNSGLQQSSSLYSSSDTLHISHRSHALYNSTVQPRSSSPPGGPTHTWLRGPEEPHIPGLPPLEQVLQHAGLNLLGVTLRASSPDAAVPSRKGASGPALPQAPGASDQSITLQAASAYDSGAGSPVAGIDNHQQAQRQQGQVSASGAEALHTVKGVTPPRYSQTFPAAWSSVTHTLPEDGNEALADVEVQQALILSGCAGTGPGRGHGAASSVQASEDGGQTCSLESPPVAQAQQQLSNPSSTSAASPTSGYTPMNRRLAMAAADLLCVAVAGAAGGCIGHACLDRRSRYGSTPVPCRRRR